EIVAQDVEKRGGGIDVHRVRSSVDLQGDTAHVPPRSTGLCGRRPARSTRRRGISSNVGNGVEPMKKSTICVFALALGLTVILTASSRQRQRSDDFSCRVQEWGRDRAGACEIRDYTVPASGATLAVNAEPNGGIQVEGAPRMDVLVRAKVVATADTEDA